MPIDQAHTPAPILYLPHGAGPLPLLGDRDHLEMIDFLHKIRPALGKPAAILVISAHWEEQKPTLTLGAHPPLIYDYYGFPEQSYRIQYPAPGDPLLARSVHSLLEENGIEALLDDQRGFDHGVFVPLGQRVHWVAWLPDAKAVALTVLFISVFTGMASRLIVNWDGDVRSLVASRGRRFC